MASFSERMGILRARTALQLDGMDQRLRTRLWNVVHGLLLDKAAPKNGLRTSFVRGDLPSRLLDRFLSQPVDESPAYVWGHFHDLVKSWCKDCAYNQMYDLLEFLWSEVQSEWAGDLFEDSCNEVLETEMSAFRMRRGELVKLTDEQELECIDAAIDGAPNGDLAGTHISHALSMLSDRETPDFRNSIKESISAVEAVARVLTGQPKVTLGEALKGLREATGVHPALVAALDKLWGYTSDVARHAAKDHEEATFDDAKFMLVVCSAFVNYLRATAQPPED